MNTASVDDIARAIANTFAITINDVEVPGDSSVVRVFHYLPASLDTAQLPAFYLFRVGNGIPDLTGGQGHSVTRGTFLRDFEFHLATATINQQNDPAREITSRRILDYIIDTWITTYDLDDGQGDPVPYVEDWWYTGDQGLATLREYDQKFIGSILTFRVRYLWARP